MIVQFGTTSKKVNSTEIPTMTASYNCVLKEGCSIISPVIIIDRKIVGHSYNTAYIADFGRYYWIRDIVYENARQFFYLECDVLATYKSTIGSSTQYVTRSASKYNGYIVDNMYPVTNEISKTRNQMDTLDIVSKGAMFVVTVIGNDAINSTAGGLRYYGFANLSDFSNFIKAILGKNYADEVVGQVWNNLNENLKLLIDPLQYIASVKVYPYTLTGTSSQNIPIGYVNVTATCKEFSPTSEWLIKISSGTITVQHHPQIARGEYLDGPQFTDCKVYTPLGIFDVDPTAMSQAVSAVTYELDADITTGTGRFRLRARDSGALVVPIICNTLVDAIGSIGVDLPVSQIISGGVDYLGGLSGMLGSMGSALTGNYIGAVSGFVGSGLGMIGQGVANSIPKAHTTGQKGSNINLTRNLAIEYVWRLVVDDDNTNHGRPLCEDVQISTLSGYLMVESPHVSISGTREEADQVNAYLQNGIFYE